MVSDPTIGLETFKGYLAAVTGDYSNEEIRDFGAEKTAFGRKYFGKGQAYRHDRPSQTIAFWDMHTYSNFRIASIAIDLSLHMIGANVATIMVAGPTEKKIKGAEESTSLFLSFFRPLYENLNVMGFPTKIELRDMLDRFPSFKDNLSEDEMNELTLMYGWD